LFYLLLPFSYYIFRDQGIAMIVIDEKILFGQNLRVQRILKRYTQEELAHEADIDRSYYASVERGERNISLENIVKIANALEVDPARLLAGIGDYSETAASL